jgi:arylsulfatase
MKAIALIAVTLLNSVALFGQNTTGEAKKPNIVFILMGNLGYGELGCYGGGVLRGAPTPRIDKLATEVTRLLNFNVEAQCTPSRSAIIDRALSRSVGHAVGADRRRA